MRRNLALMALVLLISTPLIADTETGQVNTQTVRMYALTASGGQINVTLSWLNGGADLVMTLVCGDPEPVVFGSAMGDLNRFAQINAGVEADTPCEVGVTASSNGSKFWLNVMQQTDQSITPRGRLPITNSAADQLQPASNLTPEVVKQLNRLVRLAK